MCNALIKLVNPRVFTPKYVYHARIIMNYRIKNVYQNVLKVIIMIILRLNVNNVQLQIVYNV